MVTPQPNDSAARISSARSQILCKHQSYPSTQAALTSTLAQALAIYGPTYPYNATYDVVLTQTPTTGDYVAHLIVYKTPDSVPNRLVLRSSDPWGAPADSFEKLLHDLVVKLSDVLGELSGTAEGDWRWIHD